ncbi:DUF3969 family protein [Salmonella enterica]|nr:DUF3969 family protein [Salmonella enterica subsp. enterica serovar Oranienburg]EJX0634266.1 DUF3969 family protein [Salmonella enterica]
MKLNYKINQSNADKFIGFLTLGILYCLENKIISIDEAEGFIFKPYLPDLLRKISSASELVNIIELGCELEDIESLKPERLPNNINDLFNQTLSFIKNSKEIGRLVEKEIILTDE